jgi:outer membrane lipase/esterase
MRVPFRRVAVKSFWIASVLICIATMGAPSAWAQSACDLNSVLHDQLRGTVSGLVGPVINVAENAPVVSALAPDTTRRLTNVVQGVLDRTLNVTSGVTATAVDLVDRVELKGVGAAQLGTVVDGVVDEVVGVACNAIDGLGLQSGVAAIVTINLTDVILGRLDASRIRGGGPWPGSSGGYADGRMSLGAADKGRPAPPPGSAGPFTVYGSGTLLGGNSSGLPGAASFDYAGGTGLIGIEYGVNRNLILGLAGSVTAIDVDVDSGGNIGADVFHGAAYLSYSTRAWFVDALAAYGVVDLDLSRPGVGETVRSTTTGSAWAAAARTGYLFDFGKLRAGPVAGLTYVHASVDGDTESGDDPSALVVGDQTVDSLTSSLGVRFLAPFQANGSIFVPYLNVTWEHQFGDDAVEVTTGLAAPGAQNTSLSFPTFGSSDFGKIEGGLTVELTPGASVNLSGGSTFARDDGGEDYRFSAGLNYRF